MAPKKVDLQAKQKEHQAYKQTEEYKKIQDIQDQIKIHLHPFITQTSRDYDLTGKYQVFWDQIYELSVLMKVKPPFKKLQHEWMRSIFFGQKKKVDKNDPIYYLDGLNCEFDPVDADSQHHIRQALIKKVTNFIGQKDNFDVENYTKTRAQIKKGLSEMYSLIKNYSKKSFKVIYQEKFMQLLKPFSDLLQINMKLVLFQLKYTSDDDKYINQFKKTAIVQRFCQCLQKSLQILMSYHSKPILYKIKPNNVFKKLAYQNLSKVQHFYLDPFRDSFQTLKKGLCALFTSGINFWKVPLQQNLKFVQNVKDLVNWQLVCERHFGNPLVKDQTNFMADALASIDKANDLSKKYMITKDANCMEIAIPQLVAFKTIQHMRKYKDKQEQIALKQQERNKLMGITIQDNNDQLQQGKSIHDSPSGTKQFKNESFEKSKVTLKNTGGLLRKDSLQQQKNNLGRYWIWQNYCDNDFKNTVIEEAVQKLRHINKAIQQDIQDTIVREGMLPRKDRHDQQRISAADTLKNMKTYHNADKAQNLRRPPELWNFPKVFEQQHKFRSIADPKKCYVDGRIEDLDKHLVKIGNHFRTHNKRDWNQLVRRIIDFFDGHPNSDPAFEDI